VRLGVPARHIQADFANHGLRHADIDTVDSRQVNATNAMELTAQVELGRVAACFPASLDARTRVAVSGRRGRFGVARCVGGLVGHALQMPFQRQITFRDPLQ
jgi:hypothetical protein